MKKFNLLIGMILINFVSIILGFLRDSSIVYKLGANQNSDAFIFITTLPITLFSAIGWVVSTTFVPIYTHIKNNESEGNANLFASNFLNILFLIVTIIVVILQLFRVQVIRILAPGFNGETFQTVLNLASIILPSMLCYVITYCFVGILTSHKNLIWTSAIGIPTNLFLILGILFFYNWYGLKGATEFSFIGSIAQFAMLIIPLKKIGFKYITYINIRDSHILEALKMIGPMIIGVMAIQINSLVTSMIASTLNPGTITSINLGMKVNNSIYNSLVFIIITYTFPFLAEAISKKDIDKFNVLIYGGLQLVFLILLPIAVNLIFFRKEVITILFGHGNFSGKNILTTSFILIFYSASLLFMGIKDLINRVFYATKNTKTPMYNSIISICINIILSIALAHYWGVYGLAASSAVATITAALLLYRSLIKGFDIENKRILVMILKIAIICLFLYVFLSLIKSILAGKLILLAYFFVTGTLGVGFYIICLWIFKVDIKSLLSLFSKK
ncbi:murein biosynthesis integral membrane protein MurJ [Candidatus Clostridium stratigraminis]|uniref:Murein biosynthesis integral membrane protein MurJ n=1 Tax=Candidatus Clostridium stratigraminis TaxID=3381661 RepID=A0ABW8T3K7_9CLOT